MRTVWMGKRSLMDRRADYFLVVDEANELEDYGVKIEMDGAEAAQILHITVSDRRIEELLQLLMRNTVTPTGLPDVIADWL